MGNMITKIDGNWINDPSAIHDISANERSYTIRLGNSNSKFTDTSVIDIPSDVNTILDNLTTHLILKDVVVPDDISVYNKLEVNALIDPISVRTTFVENLSGEVAEYNPYVTYYLDMYCKKDGYLHKCVVTSAVGVWDPSCWLKTSLYDEIVDLKGV